MYHADIKAYVVVVLSNYQAYGMTALLSAGDVQADVLCLRQIWNCLPFD